MLELVIFTILSFLGMWIDEPCRSKKCTVCNVKSAAPVFEMRGLCYGTSFDQHFSWSREWDKETEHYNFQGFSNSFIQWNHDRKEWRLTLYANKTIYGTCNETLGLYPFGTFNWHIYNDTCYAENPNHSSQFVKRAISFSGWCRDTTRNN